LLRGAAECGSIVYPPELLLYAAWVLESTIACCNKKGLWTPEEDKALVSFIKANGHASWRLLPKLAVVSFFLNQIHQRS
jgi:hypothetical protein